MRNLHCTYCDGPQEPIRPEFQAFIDTGIARWAGALRKLSEWPEEDRFGAQSCPQCDSPLRPRGWSGVECTKCSWWFCY